MKPRQQASLATPPLRVVRVGFHAVAGWILVDARETDRRVNQSDV
jgi:hypothetical protein